MITMRHGGAPAAASCSATVFACHNANWLPRVPMRSSTRSLALASGRTRPRAERLDAAVGFLLGLVEAEDARDGFGVHRRRFGIGQRLELLGRHQQELFDEQMRD